MPERLLLTGALTVIVSLCYAYAGRTILQRHVAPEARIARASFVAWWFAVAAISVLQAASAFAAYGGVLDLPLALTVLHVNVLLACVAVGALVYYLVFLYTGRNRHLVPVVAGYAALYTYYLYVISAREPVGLTQGAWRVDIEYASAFSVAGSLLLVALLLVTPVLSAFAYLAITLRTSDRAVRYRGTLVSSSIILWLLGTLVVRISTDQTLIVVGSLVLGLVGAVMTLLAYRPPAAVARWLETPSSQA